MNNNSKYGNTEKKFLLFFFFFLQIYNRTRFLKKEQEATDDIITGQSRTDQTNNELSSDHK